MQTNQLVHQNGERLFVTSLDISNRFAKRHDNVRLAINNLECSEQFRRLNFKEIKYTDGKGRQQPMYEITRDGFVFLCMGFTGADAAQWKEKYIQAFNLMEQQIKQQSVSFDSLLSNPIALRNALLTYSERVSGLETQVSALTPKAEALDRIATKSEGSMCVTDAAKLLQMQPKQLFGWLQSNGWIYRRVGGVSWVAYQAKLKTGELEHKITKIERSDGSEKITEQVLVTAKGLANLSTINFSMKA